MSTTHTGNDHAVTQCVYPAHPDDWQPHHAHIGYLCRPGYRRLEQQLAELPALADWLHANLPATGNSAPNPMRVTSSDDFPTPLGVDIHDHIEDIRAKLVSWTLNVCDDRDLRGPGNSHPSATSTFLLAHLEWAAEQPWVDAFAGEINDLHRDGHKLVPSQPRTHRLDLPCTECQTTTLVREDGKEYIQCESCGRLWKEREYQWLCRRVVREQEDASGWLLPEVVAALVDVNPKTLRTWARRGVIASACNVLPGVIRDERIRVHPHEVEVLVAWDAALAEQAERDTESRTA